MSSIRSRLSLRHVLPLIFFLLAAIPAATIGILITQRAWDHALHNVRDQHLQLARNVAEALQRYAADASAVFNLAVSNLVNDQPVTGLSLLLDRLHFKHVCLVDKEGQVKRFIATDSNLQLRKLPPHLLDSFHNNEADISLQPTFNAVRLDGLNTPTIFVTSELDNQLFAVGALKTDYFVALQSAIRLGTTGHAAIVDQRGHILAHPDPQWQQEMRDISHIEPVSRMIAGETGVSQFFSPATQQAMIAGYTVVPQTGWGVMIPQPVLELKAHVNRGRRTVWLAILIALFCSSLLGWLVSHWLATPLQHIGALASQFADGAYGVRVKNLGFLHTREAATLGAQFNAMANDVNRSWQSQKASEERLRDFAQIAADWLWEIDHNEVFTYISPAPEAVRNWNLEVFLGHHWRTLLERNANPSPIATLQAYITKGEPFDDIDFSISGHDDQPIHIALAGRPIHNTAGDVVGYRGVVRDITSRLKVEAQLHQAQRAEELREAQKLEAIGTLASGITHDFNNILSVILGFSELTLNELPPSSPSHNNLQQIVTAGRRAKELVQQILTFSRKSKLQRAPLHLRFLMQETIKLLRASIPTTIEIRQNIVSKNDTVLADPTQMHQILVNLCANAAYAMRDGGGVLSLELDMVTTGGADFTCSPSLSPGQYVRLIVCDTGHGMDSAIKARIFEPFFTTKAEGEGTGMGLAVVHGIVASHEGAITIDSMPAQGTTVTIYLPLLVESALDKQNPTPDMLSLPSAPEWQIATPSAPTMPDDTERILFVDDEESLVRLGDKTLARQGYTVVTATSSLEALATFQAAPHAFDLVITDQTMPHMTGANLARELRTIRADIPIILCTGFSHDMDADKATAQGIDAFLLKPIQAQELILTVQDVLSQREL